jgi:hypothetical protein
MLITSHGQCIYCKQNIAQSAMTRHLQTHLTSLQKNAASEELQTYCHIEVKAHVYFLHFLISGKEELEILDDALRDIWLECCGHMSGFFNNKEEIEVDELVQNVLLPKTKLKYIYDYGTSTTLEIIAHKHYELPAQEDIELLTRNEPLKIMCNGCNENAAVEICIGCSYRNDGYLCKLCMKKHKKTCDELEDFGKLPVVNSPRVGDCGYTGGSADRARDGYYKEK